MSAADDAYARLLAAQRFMTPEEREVREADDKRNNQETRIRRKLQRVY